MMIQLSTPQLQEQVVQLDSWYDRSFRNIAESEWGVSSDGDVESPTGYFWLVEIPEHAGERAEMFTACEVGRDWDDGVYQYPEPVPSWYLVTTDSNGLWWVYEADSEEAAKQVYLELEQAYATWSTTEEEQ